MSPGAAAAGPLVAAGAAPAAVAAGAAAPLVAAGCAAGAEVGAEVAAPEPHAASRAVVPRTSGPRIAWTRNSLRVVRFTTCLLRQRLSGLHRVSGLLSGSGRHRGAA